MSSTNETEASSAPEYNSLTAAEERVIVGKGTEQRFVGEYTDLKEAGTYVCRRCNARLYHSTDKFDSECGWPSFDDEIVNVIPFPRERARDANLQLARRYWKDAQRIT